MAQVLILDQTGSAVDFALRCTASGHTVKTCMAYDKKTGQRRAIGDGLIDKVEREDWQRWKTWADIIITTDNVKWLPELDMYKRRGFPVFAPSHESAQLELDRNKGQAFLKTHGIKVIASEPFTDYRKAEKMVASTMGRFVSKPNGDKDRALSYVSTGPRDLIFMLRRWARSLGNTAGEFLLQEFVPGTEFSVNGWLGPKGFAEFFEQEVEYKKLMNDDYGQNTGQMGGVIKYSATPKLAEDLLLPLERDLIKMGHTGSIDVSAIIDEDGVPRPLEFTSRPGWPSFNIVQCLHPEPVEWMCDLLDGKDTFRPSEDIAVGIVLAIPDYPVSHFTKKEVSDVPLYDLNDDNPYRTYLHPCEVKSGSAPDEDGGLIVERRMFVSCGDYLAVATGVGDTVREAKTECDKAVDSIQIPNNMIRRTDIGDSLRRDLPKLNAHGYATDWEY